MLAYDCKAYHQKENKKNHSKFWGVKIGIIDEIHKTPNGFALGAAPRAQIR